MNDPVDTKRRSGSLRGRLTGAVMVPLAAMVVCFGFLTCLSLHNTYSLTSDRVLVGSVRTLSAALDADPTIRGKLVPLAVHLLQRRSRPVTHYSIYHGDRLIAGMASLKPPPDYSADDRTIDRHPPASFPQFFRDTELYRGYVDPRDATSVIQAAYLRDGTLNGKDARIATEIRLIKGEKHPIAIQLADFRDDRQAYELGLYLQVIGAGVLILLIAVLLFWWAVSWGLAPFAALTEQVEAARDEPPAHFRLVPPRDTLREAIPFIQAFNGLMARMEKATESLKHFTANASHQLRTPLAIVRVHLDVLDRFGADSARGKAALREIPDAIALLERLLLQLISLARTEEQVVDPEMTFDLLETATAIAEDRACQNGAEDLDIAFEHDSGESLIARGHPALAAELLGNLIDNAIRYNRPGGSVVIRLRRDDGAAVVEIEDDGPGIPEAERARVWERFYRARAANDQIGSGLGLPIVRALAERMGAAVSLSSGRDGTGVRATVEFKSAA